MYEVREEQLVRNDSSDGRHVGVSLESVCRQADKSSPTYDLQLDGLALELNGADFLYDIKKATET